MCPGTIQEAAMPLQYDPETGVPSFLPDIGEELEEGVTPKPVVIDTKAGVFKGDKPLTKDGYDALRDGMPKGTIEDIKMADEMLEHAIRNAKPAVLEYCATDEDVEELERMVVARKLKEWPLLLRIVNRLHRAENKRRPLSEA
jgi:hypothetical protein